MRSPTAVRLACVSCFLIAASRSVPAQTEADVAMRFFSAGGAYCVRLAPEGTDLSEETAWTVMLLTSASNRRNEFRIRSVTPATPGMDNRTLKALGMDVTAIWRREGLRDDFFERFAGAITAGATRARVVLVSPARLAEIKPRERAEVYLKFADKGTKVDFSKAPDLSAEQFLTYQTYIPD